MTDDNQPRSIGHGLKNRFHNIFRGTQSKRRTRVVRCGLITTTEPCRHQARTDTFARFAPDSNDGTVFVIGQKDFVARGKKVLAKIRRHATRDYVLHPLLSGPSALTTLTANLTANLVRNLWTHSVIMCGHFPEGVQTFAKSSIEGETRGQWYLRQMLGSANISGSPATHFMTGNLSYQIEHHLFPDLPSNRYHEIAPQVEEIFERYGLTYTTGPLPKQVASAWAKIIRLSLPNRPDRRKQP